MLQLRDAVTRRLVAVGGSAVLRMVVTPPEPHSAADLTGVRVLLVGDSLRRIRELSGIQVLTAVVSPTRTRSWLNAVRNDFGIAPPHEVVETETEAANVLLGRPHLRVVPADALTPGADILLGRPHLRVVPADALTPGADVPTVAVAGAWRNFPRDADPLAQRLALSARHYARPVLLDHSHLAAAQADLTAWRSAVAAWADCPSAPVPAEYVQAARQALEDDLDLPRVVDLLRAAAADPRLPDGAKFETFAYLDRVLAIELCRGMTTR